MRSMSDWVNMNVIDCDKLDTNIMAEEGTRRRPRKENQKVVFIPNSVTPHLDLLY